MSAGDSRAPTRAEREAADRARLVARRAIRRLDVLEWVMFLGGAGLATGLGFVVAIFLSGITGWPFRPTWIGAAILLFVVPGGIAVLKIKRDERADAERLAGLKERDDG